MRIGNLRHKITIQENTPTPDGMGSSTASWSAFAAVWAAVWPIAATERVKNQAVEHEITHRIRVRYLAGVKSDMRILFGDRVFEITAIINSCERNKTLDLLCNELSS